jgi:3-oxoadipate enol-lactonase
LAKADLREQLKTITVPTLVVAGLQDPVTTIADGEYMVEHIPNSQLFKIDASHISNIEQPRVFNYILHQFLNA